MAERVDVDSAVSAEALAKAEEYVQQEEGAGNRLTGLTTIIESNAVDVVNMSFGGPEAGYTAPYNGGTDLTGFLKIYDDFFMEGNSLGITFVAASGDWGGLDIPAAACFSASPPKPVCGPMEVGIGLPASTHKQSHY